MNGLDTSEEINTEISLNSQLIEKFVLNILSVTDDKLGITEVGQKSKETLIIASTAKLTVVSRDRVNAEIVHFYAKKSQKMQHRNFNTSQDARC